MYILLSNIAFSTLKPEKKFKGQIPLSVLSTLGVSVESGGRCDVNKLGDHESAILQSSITKPLDYGKMDFESLKSQVSNLTLYDLKAGVRKVQNGESVV